MTFQVLPGRFGLYFSWIRLTPCLSLETSEKWVWREHGDASMKKLASETSSAAAPNIVIAG